MRSNDLAWEKIFEQLKIADCIVKDQSYSISAKQINQIGKREARLMAKFDTKESLPQIFKQEELNITATTNGQYLIYKDREHKSFVTLPDYKSFTPKKIIPSLDFKLETLSFNSSMSESNAIDFAHHSNILSIYSGEKELKLTARGRLFSDVFTLQLTGIGDVNIKGVQIEVDAGYEGREQFLIIEAKSSTRATFNIRQLYYPYRHFLNKTKKQIRTILLSFSNGVYFFTEIKLNDDYYKYEIVNTVAFEVQVGTEVKNVSLTKLLSQKTYVPINIPVPQADDLNKVIDLIFFLQDGPKDKFEIADYFEFDERQGDYYGNASAYIGFTQKQGGSFKLTSAGSELSKIKNRKSRNTSVIQNILQTRLFNDLIALYLVQEKTIEDAQILNRLFQEGLSGQTPMRRKSTIKSWLQWVINEIGH